MPVERPSRVLRRPAPLLALVALFVLLWTVPRLPALAQETASPAQLRLDLDRLRGQITSLENRLADMGERRDNLVDDFEVADVRLALSRRQLEVVQVRLLVLFQQSQEREAEVGRLTLELERARDELAARVVALYRMGPLSYSRFLLAAQDADEILANYQIVNRLATQDRTLVVTIDTRLGQHRDAVELLTETTKRLEETRAEETLAIRQLTAQQLERQRLIRDIDIESAAGRQALEEQEESAAAMEDLLGEIGNATTVAAPRDERPAFAGAQGNLPWPAEGPVTETFGRKVHPVYDTVTLFKGIEIDAGAGTSVRAVYQGRVAFADWFQNYGLVVIVNHGDDFFTIYGHLDAVAVRTGEWVDGGAEVGTVGETGSLIGPSLYFEIREGPDAVNPTQWLRRR